MQKDSFEEMGQIYNTMLLQEKFADIFRNAAVPLIRYFRCKQGLSTAEQCPQPQQVLDTLKQWLSVNPQHPYAARVSKLINVPDDPEKVLANLRFNLEYMK